MSLLLVMAVAAAMSAIVPYEVQPPAVEASSDYPTVDGRFEGEGAIGPQGVWNVTVTGRAGVPATGVAAVALNVTATNPTNTTYLTIWPTGDTRPVASNLNTTPGQTIANMVIAKVGTNGQISIYNLAGTTDVIIDIVGWYPTGNTYTPLTPARLADTRPGQPTIDNRHAGTGPITTNNHIDITVTGRAGVPATGVAAVALNVTATNPTNTTYLTIWPTGDTRPVASNLNTTPGQTIANMVIAKVGTNGQISIYNLAGTTDVIIDIVGWYPTGNTYTPLTPARLADTRTAPPPAPPATGIRLSTGMSRSGEWVAQQLGVLAAPAQAVTLRIVSDPGQACAIGVEGVIGVRPGVCSVQATTRSGTGTAVLNVSPAPARSGDDRPGPNVLDLKPLYIRFSDSPDSRRDMNGSTADLAQDLADWTAVQYPGFTLRLDTTDGVPDVRTIDLPITTAQFLARWTGNIGPLPELLAEYGITAPGSDPSVPGYTDMKRIYVGFVEGPRGQYRSPNSNTEGGCGSATGSNMVLYYVRELDGRECSHLTASYRGPMQYWIGYDGMRLLIDLLPANAGCDKVLYDRYGVPLDQRPGSLTPPSDVIAYGYRGGTMPRTMDPTNSYYFKVKSGPGRGNPCVDIAYSPFMTQSDRGPQPSDRRADRSTVDRPDDLTGPQVRVLYVLPADVPDEGLDIDGRLNTAFMTTNEWLFANGGKRVRYDTAGGKLDVGFIRLPHTEAQLWLKPYGTGDKCGTDRTCPHLSDLFVELQKIGAITEGKIHLVVLAGAVAPVSRAPGLSCAIAGGREQMGLAYRGMRHLTGNYIQCQPAMVTGVPTSTNSLGLILNHELFHVLGAVGQAAPNDDGGGHIANNPSDLMGGSEGIVQLDPGRDDYWGHGRTDLVDISRSVYLTG